MADDDPLLSKAFDEMKKGNPDLKAVFELLQSSAKENNAEAIYAIGTWYLHGKFVKKNPSLAVEYFLKSIEGNNNSAYFDLAVCYEEGVGVSSNNKKAFECYLNAALLQDKQAMYEVGRCYYYGIGISKNTTIANIWLKHAAANGITS